MLQTPDPLFQPLEDDIFLCFISGDPRRRKVIVGIVPPNRRKSADIDVRNRKIITKLKFIIERIPSVKPIARLVVAAAFAFQYARFTVRTSCKPPVKIGQRIRMVGVLYRLVSSVTVSPVFCAYQ